MLTQKRPTKIESRKNEKVRLFLKLAESKKARNQRNLCVLEGLRLTVDAFHFGVRFHQLLLSEPVFRKLEHDEPQLLSSCRSCLIDEKVASEISSVVANQGVFAIVEKPKNHKLSSFESNQNILILVELSNPGNIGALIRSAVAFGFRSIVLANCCDVCNTKVVRSSMGAIFKAKISECSVAELKNWLQQTTLTTIAAVLNSSGVQQINNIKNCALLIGNEANGLTSEIINLCKVRTSIVMQNQIESLNASIAGSVLMFALSREINF